LTLLSCFLLDIKLFDDEETAVAKKEFVPHCNLLLSCLLRSCRS
jgi:hypothetical protein